MKKCVIVKIHSDDFSHKIEEDGHLSEEGNLTGTDKELCFNSKKCCRVTGKGNATFIHTEDGDLISMDPNGDNNYFGSCPKICDNHPILASTQRALDIFLVISSISTTEELINISTWRYKAICWLIYDDPKQLQATNPSLIQRYVLALFYLSTAGWNWFVNIGFMNPTDECSWGGVVCAGGYVTELNFGT